MNLSLDLSMKQQLKLSPQMIQSFALMAMPLPELEAHIKKAIEDNPVLEMHKADPPSVDSFPDIDAHRDWNDLRESSFYDEAASDRAQSFMANTISNSESLQDHLLSQLGCTQLSDQEYLTGETLITLLDSNGFFPGDPHELVKPDQLPYVDKLCSIIQNYDPTGCAVTDWKQSLIVQAEAKNLKDRELEIFKGLVEHNLPLMKKGKTEQVAQKLHTDSEEIEALFDLLKTFTPFPGAGFSSGPGNYVVPEISIRKKDDKLVMRLNRSAFPDLTISREYENMSRELDNGDAKNYLNEQIATAKALIGQLQMRNQTLAKVGSVLLIEQREFFFKGPKYLKPLIQKDVADKIGVHETTISRISTGKWIDTDWGIFPVKKLFSTAADEKGHSKTSIKAMVKEIVENYTGEKRLTDQRISDMLEEKGVKIARRTVAKYRKELNIESSFDR